MTEVLSAPNILEYTYTRTTGPVIGRFMTGLRKIATSPACTFLLIRHLVKNVGQNIARNAAFPKQSPRTAKQRERYR